MAFSFETEDQRPPLVFSDINGLMLDGLKAQKPAAVDMIRLEKVDHWTVRHSTGIADRQKAAANCAKE